MMRGTRLWRVLLVFIAGFACAAPAFSQTTGVLKGRVTDPQNAAVPGATVTVSSPELQGLREAVTDAAGDYVVLGLPPGTYALAVELAGFQKFVQPGLLLRAGQTLIINVPLKVGDVSEAVTVSGRADTPIIDVENPELHFNVSGEFLRQLPLGSRQQWDQLWQLIPGVVTSARSGDGDIEANIHGASERSNVMKVDGFDMGNAFTNQHWTTQFSTEAIQDVSIKTAGLDASTPLGRGGFLNIVTKSGGNEMHGSGAMFFQPRRWNGNNIPGGRSLDQEFYQPDASIGGPILRDRTWYFASYRRVYTDEGVPRTAAVLQSFVDNGFEVPDYDKLFRNNRFFGKATHKAGSGSTLTFTYLDDRGMTFNSDSRDQGTRESTIDIATGGPQAQVAWNHVIGGRFLLTAQYGYRRILSNVYPGGGETSPAFVRYARTTLSGGVPVGQDTLLFYGNRAGQAIWSNGVRDHHELTADASYLIRRGGGRHMLQAGLQYKPRSRAFSESITPANGPALIEEVRVVGPNGSVTYVPFHRLTRDPATVGSSNITYALRGVYVQDKWQPTAGLSITLGLRYDRQQTSDTLDIWGIDSGSFNPRLGAAYALSDNSRDVLRASWGRMNDLLYTQIAPSAGGNAVASRIDEYDVNLDGTFETVRTVPAVLARTVPPEDRLLDPDLATPISDELHVGYTRQLPGRVSVDVAYVNKVFKHEIGSRDTNIIYENNRFVGYRNPAFNAIPITTNLDNSKRKYHALEFSVIRNIGARWSAFANYTYQKMTEIGEWAIDDPNRYLHPGDWFEHDKLARPHVLRLNGSYRAPWGIQSAVIYSLTSGNYAFAPVTTTLPAPDSAFGPSTVILPNGRAVSNPLATTTRFVGPRGDNTLQGPTVHRLNLRFGKQVRMPGAGSLDVNVDLFNVTNNGARLFFRSTNNTSPLFGQFSSSTQAPRAGQVSVVYRF
jgi:hypothetical protein